MSGYIGTQPVPQATQTRQTFTATAAQTSFATAGYTAGFLDVYLNGVKLQDGVDYTATNGSDIVLTVGAALDDTLEVVAYTAFEVADAATAAQGALADTAVQPADNLSTLTNDVGYLTVAPAPFVPLAVTGTTPSLDVGTYNFFDNGTLSGDTTVTFASVPTQARWTYTFTADLLTTYDLSNGAYLQNYSVITNSGIPYGLFFKPDGTKMYVAGNTSGSIGEYDLSTAWDVSTASFLQNFSVATEETNIRSVFFKPDGTKMYVNGVTGDDVNEYDLSTAWDVSTASFLQLFSVAAQDTAPWGLFFKPDGTKMYVVGSTGVDINEYNLSTAWNVTTAVYLQLFSVSAQEANPRGIFFKPDGTSMYVCGSTGDDVNEYSLLNAWNISTASFLRLFSVSAQDTAPSALFFSTNGAKMYMAGQTGNDINEYDVSTGTALTLPSSVQNPPTEDGGVGSKATYEFYTLDGGTNVYLINEEVL